MSKVFFSGSVVFLLGNLGLGKTSLVRSFIGNLFNYRLIVKSPTYSMLEIYVFLNNSICHFDLYRLLKVHDLFDLGLNNYYGENIMLFIEWGAKFYSFFIPNILIYFFCYSDVGRIFVLKSKIVNFRKVFGY